jgi:transposase
VQKEDVTFEFDKRRNRWYGCLVYDDETTPTTHVSVQNGDVVVLDLGLTPPATVFSPTNTAAYNPFPDDFDARRLAKWHVIEKLQRAIANRKWARAQEKVGAGNFTRTKNKYRRTTQRMKATLARKHLNFVE